MDDFASGTGTSYFRVRGKSGQTAGGIRSAVNRTDLDRKPRAMRNGDGRDHRRLGSSMVAFWARPTSSAAFANLCGACGWTAIAALATCRTEAASDLGDSSASHSL